jgi:hypothetical protein
VVYAASRSGVLVLATTNDSATSPRPLGTLPRPRTAYQASLDIAARLAAADPATAALNTSGNSWPTSSASSIEQLTLRSRRRGPQRSEETRRQAGEAGP